MAAALTTTVVCADNGARPVQWLQVNVFAESAAVQLQSACWKCVDRRSRPQRRRDWRCGRARRRQATPSRCCSSAGLARTAHLHLQLPAPAGVARRAAKAVLGQATSPSARSPALQRLSTCGHSLVRLLLASPADDEPSASFDSRLQRQYRPPCNRRAASTISHSTAGKSTSGWTPRTLAASCPSCPRRRQRTRPTSLKRTIRTD